MDPESHRMFFRIAEHNSAATIVHVHGRATSFRAYRNVIGSRRKAKANGSTELAEVDSTELVEVLGPTRSFGRDALRRVLRACDKPVPIKVIFADRYLTTDSNWARSMDKVTYSITER
jgi:deoxyribose-phosphate aldolase